MAVRTAPASFDAFERDYDYFIEVTIHRISRGCLRRQDLLDLKQAVYTRIVETKYLDRYNPEKGAFSTYLFSLIRSVVANQFDKNTRNPLNTAIGVRETRGRRADPTCLVLETHKDLQDATWERRQEAADLMDRFKAFAAKFPEGRDLSEILRLLYEGYEVEEIASRLGKRLGTTKRLRDDLKAALRSRFAEVVP